MPKPTLEEHARHLRDAERQFKLMISVRTAVSLRTQPRTVPQVVTFGQVRMDSRDLRLSLESADLAAASLEHAATLALCIVAAQAMADTVSDEQRSDAAINAAFEISRLLRNAYVHQPMRPVWRVGAGCRTVYEVPGVIRLDASALDGVEVTWQSYGGHLVLLRLSEWIRSNLLNDTKRDVADEPAAGEPVVHQQGRMLLRMLDAIPLGTEVYSLADGPVTYHIPDGPYTFKHMDPPKQADG